MGSKKSRSSVRSAPRAEPPFLAALHKAAQGPAPGSLLDEVRAAIAAPETQRVHGALLRQAKAVRQVERSHKPSRMTVPAPCLPPVA